MSKLIYTENPTEQDFPLIDRCVMCDGVCAYQPRYEIACRDALHSQRLAEGRPLGFVPSVRVVKLCATCIPDANASLRRLIRHHYPVYAKKEGI